MTNITPRTDERWEGGFVRDTTTGELTVKVTQGNVSLSTTDVEVGGVEIKNGTDDTRATVTASNALKVDGSAVTQPVSGSFYQSTQPVSLATNTPDVTDRSARLLGHVTVDAAPATAVTGPLTDTQLRATAVPVSGTVTASGPLTDTQLRNTAVPVSGPLTDTQIRATALPVSGTVTASGPLTDTQLRATAVPVSGTVTASGPLTDTQLRATAVPVSGTVTASGPLTDTQLRASAVPVDTELPAAASLADTASNLSTPTVGAFTSTFNGTNWDRFRGNVDTTTGDSGSKVNSFAGATQTNYNALGAIITVKLGTVSGTSPTLSCQLQWSYDGTNFLNIGTALANLISTGQIGTYIVYPANISSAAGSTPAALTTGANQTTYLNLSLPRTWRINYTIGGTATPTFPITGVYVNYLL